MLIDTHSHLFVEEFNADLPEVIQRAKLAGVSRIYMPNIDLASISSLLDVCQQYKDYCYPMLGLHPTSVTSDYQKELLSLKQYLKQGHPFVAIGEIGLDFYWDRTFSQEQMKVFDEQVQWAIAYRLPIIIHCREAYAELCRCLEPYRSENLCGIFHCYAGPKEIAEELMTYEGFMFGVNGSVTYKKSVLPELFRTTIPLNRVVLETDSPYLAPVPHRGKRNESSYIKEVSAKMSEIYNKPVEEIERITSENALKVFTTG